jgi:hypothetical protein
VRMSIAFAKCSGKYVRMDSDWFAIIRTPQKVAI